MNIFVTSDTHHSLSRVLEMYAQITSANTPEGVPHVDRFDYIIHCGDYKADALELSSRLRIPAVCVYGNCDGVWDRDFDVLETEAGRILVTHGHIEGVNYSHDELYELAEEQGCGMICYGHTHIPVCRKENGYLVLNPGSPSRPLDGTKGSCAVITADESGFSAKLVYYGGMKKKTQGSGGFLRKIFNYSDGQ